MVGPMHAVMCLVVLVEMNMMMMLMRMMSILRIMVVGGGQARVLVVRARRVDLDVRVVEALDVVLLLPLHASVLEPDLDLTFGERQRVRDLNAPPTCQVPRVSTTSFLNSML